MVFEGGVVVDDDGGGLRGSISRPGERDLLRDLLLLLLVCLEHCCWLDIEDTAEEETAEAEAESAVAVAAAAAAADTEQLEALVGVTAPVVEGVTVDGEDVVTAAAAAVLFLSLLIFLLTVLLWSFVC